MQQSATVKASRHNEWGIDIVQFPRFFKVTPRTAHSAVNGHYSEQDGQCVSKAAYRPHALERARIFRRLRLSLRDLFFFHFSLILRDDTLAKIAGKENTRHT
jgi:hypothetical protein